MASVLQNSLKRTTASLLLTQSRLVSATATTTTRALSTTAPIRHATTSTSPPSASSDNHNSTSSIDSTSSTDSAPVPPLKLSKEQRELLEEMIRVDQAGELGANWIYRGQYAVLGSDKKVGPLLQVGPLSLFFPFHLFDYHPLQRQVALFSSWEHGQLF